MTKTLQLKIRRPKNPVRHLTLTVTRPDQDPDRHRDHGPGEGMRVSHLPADMMPNSPELYATLSPGLEEQLADWVQGQVTREKEPISLTALDLLQVLALMEPDDLVLECGFSRPMSRVDE